MSQEHGGESRLWTASVVLFSVLAAISAQSIWSHPEAYANSCSISMTPPSLASQFSHPLREATAGEQFIITTTISNHCSKQDQPFVGIIEARNSEGVTEIFGWQGGVLKGASGETAIGISWVPTHGDSYQLRTFALSDLEHPVILSSVITTNVAIAANVGKAVVSIPFDPNPPLHSSTFQPDLIKIMIGVSNTVIWTNGDNASHRLTGQTSGPNSIPLDFEGPIFLYPGYSLEHTFLQTGLYEYIDIDRPWMHGFVQVYGASASEQTKPTSNDNRINGNVTISPDIKHCIAPGSDVAAAGPKRLEDSVRIPSVTSSDDNALLTLSVDDREVTEYENQYFFVGVYNKAQQPLIFPPISGDQFTINFYNRAGDLLMRLGGEQTPFHGAYSGTSEEEELKKPACFIDPNESFTFSTWTRIGTKDHDTRKILYASATVPYVINGKTDFLRTVIADDEDNGVQSDNVAETDRHLSGNASNLLKIEVNPVMLPKMNDSAYFDVAIAAPYAPRVGEDDPLWAIARTTLYRGNYSVRWYLPGGIQLVSGGISADGYLFPDKYVGVDGNFVVNVQEQEAAKVIIRPLEAGNYTIRATIFSDFNGTRIHREDAIWLSTSSSSSSTFVTRTTLPNSVEPLQSPLPATQLKEIDDPIPKIRLAITDKEDGKYNATKADFCWSDTPMWWRMAAHPLILFVILPILYPMKI